MDARMRLFVVGSQCAERSGAPRAHPVVGAARRGDGVLPGGQPPGLRHHYERCRGQVYPHRSDVFV